MLPSFRLLPKALNREVRKDIPRRMQRRQTALTPRRKSFADMRALFTIEDSSAQVSAAGGSKHTLDQTNHNSSATPSVSAGVCPTVYWRGGGGPLGLTRG